MNYGEEQMKERATGEVAKISIVCAAFCILVFMLGLVSTDCQADETPVPSFGEGKINVRLSTDYFCAPCREMEPDIEPILAELVQENIIRLTFIDTPFYRSSSLYARYFLYAMNEKKTLDNALFVRRSLIEASKRQIYETQKLEAFLNEKKIGFKPYDVKPVFSTLSAYLKQDNIEKTPTCVTEINGKTYKYEGRPDITDALDKLRQKKSSR
ncbi:MAG: putative exported protein [Deltaproteobacteria bacterium]|nr:putative exported protein [Deltaproteobacteria bacterium]